MLADFSWEFDSFELVDKALYNPLNFVEFFLNTITLLTLEHDLASQTFCLFVHVRYFLFQLTLVEVMNAHVFVGLPIELSVLFFEDIAFNS